MKKKYFHNIITSILISSFFLMPYFAMVEKAKAQNISGYTSGLAPAIARLPQCQAVMGRGIKSLFNGIGNLFSSGSTTSGSSGNEQFLPTIAEGGDIFSEQNEINAAMNKAESDSLKSVVSAAGSAASGIYVTLPETTELKLNEIQAHTKAAEESAKATEENDLCVKSIGRLIIKMLLQKMTVSTVNWINSGFEGSPAFIQDPEKFFSDIAKNEVLQFGLEINNPDLFPFGKEWVKNNALVFNNKFQDNAQYSLNKLIQETNPAYDATTFSQDFSMGGWDAWSAMTQIPANNPLGFKLMADNEIQKRLTGTAQSNAENIREALQQANGFLGDQRCINPEGITREQHNEALIDGKKDSNGDIIGICEEWEYVTPGSMVAKAATDTMGFTKDSLLSADDLNDAVAALIDAFLGQFSSKLMEDGFANLGDEGINGSLLVDSGFDSTPYKSRTQKDFIPSQLSSSWLQANPDFDIRTDLTQALIDEQRTYIDKLELQNKELISTTDNKEYKMGSNGISNAYGLLPAIYQLDYCIPGPHPGWEEDSKRTLDSVLNLVIPESAGSIEDKSEVAIVGAVKTIAPLAGAAVGASIGSVVPVVGTLIGAAIGSLVGFVVDLFSSDDANEKLAKYYSTQIEALIGLKVNPDEESSVANNILSKQGMVQGINNILYQYANRINKFYDSKLLPTVTQRATTNFYNINGYYQMIKNNENKIASLINIKNSLNSIKEAIDKLNDEYPTIEERGEEYENKLKVQINAFGRLSSEMVNGEDISKADLLLKQIIDKKNIVYNDLLKGPYGCEKNLENKLPNGPFSKQIINTKRMIYPFPIIYDYNVLTKNQNIPDPWQSGFKENKMTFNTDKDAQGPAFLPNVFYQTGDVAQDSAAQQAFCQGINDISLCMIEIRSIFPLHSPQTTVGSSNFNSGNSKIQSRGSGKFETVIGIY
ncbi:MAG: hypothetical protein NDI62_00540 [Burkholderiales bacterium]|nr:hypothetical protein [Burkholderiales bacterium]